MQKSFSRAPAVQFKQPKLMPSRTISLFLSCSPIAKGASAPAAFLFTQSQGYTRDKVVGEKKQENKITTAKHPYTTIGQTAI